MAEAAKRIRAPFDDETARSLRAGDRVLITGTILAARDAAHKRLVDTLDRGEKLPVDLKGQVVYYVGPSPAQPGQAREKTYQAYLDEKGYAGETSGAGSGRSWISMRPNSRRRLSISTTARRS